METWNYLHIAILSRTSLRKADAKSDTVFSDEDPMIFTSDEQKHRLKIHVAKQCL